MTAQPQDYALVIGINHYPESRPLRGAIGDAQAIKKWLIDDEIGGGLPPVNCKFIPSKENPLQPLKDVIDNALQEIWEQSNEGNARRFYFYFSGHGQTKQIDDVALCLANWSRNRRHAALSSHKYLNFIIHSTGFMEIIFFLDCCRIRTVGAQGLGSELSCPKPREDAGQKRSFIAYASEFQNPAYEAEVAGTSKLDDEGPVVRGHFTKALLAGLYGGAARQQGGVPASALKKYLEAEVPRIAKEAGHKQTPVIPLDMPTENEPVFGNARPEANFEIRFQQKRRGKIQLEGPDTEIVKEGDVSTGPWRITLLKGHHLLREVITGEEMPLRFIPKDGVSNVTF